MNLNNSKILFKESFMICENCNTQLDDSVKFCSNCGMALGEFEQATSSATSPVRISFPVFPFQLFNNDCIVYDQRTEQELARVKQGEYMSIPLKERTPIKIVIKGALGDPCKLEVSPGCYYKVSFVGFANVKATQTDENYKPL